MIAIAFGTINVVGGFLVTDRMLEMFKSKPKPARAPRTTRSGDGRPRRGDGHRDAAPPAGDARFLQSESFLDVLYIIAFALFIQGLRGLAGPTTAVRGNRIAAVGMAIAVIATLLDAAARATGALIALGVALGTPSGCPRRGR